MQKTKKAPWEKRKKKLENPLKTPRNSNFLLKAFCFITQKAKMQCYHKTTPQIFIRPNSKKA